MPERTRPEFVSFLGHGEVDFAAPLEATDDLLFAFAIASDRSNVQALVDSTLAAPAKGHLEYRVLGSHVLLLFQHCGRFTSPIGIGWAEDRETAIVIPLIEKRVDTHEPVKLVLWMPYLTIDVGLGLVTGRDVWGYNKSLGTTTIPPSPDDADLFRCDTLVFDSFSPETRGQVQTLIEVARADGGGAGPAPAPWTEGVLVLRELERALGPWHVRWQEDVELAVDLVELLCRGDVPVINLKQMRDTEQTTLAVHQSLVESALRVTKFHGAGLLHGSYLVRIRQCESHQLAKDFGFPAGDTKPGCSYTVPAPFAFWARLDFAAPPGKTAWSAT